MIFSWSYFATFESKNHPYQCWDNLLILHCTDFPSYPSARGKWCSCRTGRRLRRNLPEQFWIEDSEKNCEHRCGSLRQLSLNRYCRMNISRITEQMYFIQWQNIEQNDENIRKSIFLQKYRNIQTLVLNNQQRLVGLCENVS